ncbi:hypothetical protein [Pseudarthrobacter sp. fls2-241-R2A-168]|uniref:hypothetical protein n=1 Tax=Pseudarthrobacter sp. fls2-241-R2A-168 TaxID=3040304 RepID=UPI002553073E|nr:hypothetical protein [Pseudarthrobacter sp. fls2-241-R2A-168]
MSIESGSSPALRGHYPATETARAEGHDDEAPTEEMQRVNFEVPRSKRIKLKILAAKRGQSIKEFLTDYIDSFPDE